jgi:hypothetical protein
MRNVGATCIVFSVSATRKCFQEDEYRWCSAPPQFIVPTKHNGHENRLSCPLEFYKPRCCLPARHQDAQDEHEQVAELNQEAKRIANGIIELIGLEHPPGDIQDETYRNQCTQGGHGQS